MACILAPFLSAPRYGRRSHYSGLILATLLWFASLAPSAGQAGNAAIVDAHFSSILWSDGSNVREDETVKLYYQTDGQYQPLQPQFHQMGVTTYYRGPETLVLYKREKSQTQTGEQWTYRIVQSVELPDTTHFILFLLARDSRSEIRAAAIDISEDAIPSGSIAFLNLTDKRIAADIRGDQQSVQPVQTALFRPLESESPDLPLKIAVFDEAWKGVYATVTRVQADRPYLMVFHTHGSRSDAYRLRTFRNLYQIREEKPEMRPDGSELN